MKKPKDAELRVRSLKLAPRFVLSMTAALALGMGVAAVVLYAGVTTIVATVNEDTISRSVILNAKNLEGEVSLPPCANCGSLTQPICHKCSSPRSFNVGGRERLPRFEQVGKTATPHSSGVKIFSVRYFGDTTGRGQIYQYESPEADGGVRDVFFLVPDRSGMMGDLLGMIVGIVLVIVLAGAGVAYWVARQVTRPINRIIEDVRQIAKGDLEHKTRAVGGGEIELLARSVDRMTRDLDAAQETQVELSIREREMDVAGGVREALVPLATPLIEGYDLGAAYVSAWRFGGDFHDFLELDDGRVGLLVCDVSGTGVPAALVGATARATLRGELQRGGDVAEALCRCNRWLVGDMRRGMYVSALYVLIDPAAGQATVACAGHKIPLLRYAAEDEKLRVVHPEGIALGLDRGAVFDSRLEVVQVPIEVGDRFMLSNSAPVTIKNPAGRELGEKAFYTRSLKHATLETTAYLKALRRDLEQYAGGDALPVDISLVTISRLA